MFKKISVLIVVLALLLTACGGNNVDPQNESNPSDQNAETSEPVESSEVETEAPVTNSNNASDDISGAFNLLMGGTDEPSVFPSYHIELVLDSPNANSDQTAIVNEITKISADVAGKNVHIFQVDPGETTSKEGYIIGDTDKEYKLVDGTWQEQSGFIGLAWAMWPLQVVFPYSFSTAVYSNKIGTEDVNGRTAVVYELDTSKADPTVLVGMQAYMGNVTGIGKVWIDKETGAMLKLLLDYTTDVASMDGSVQLGVGTGHIELEISNVGDVTVTSPQ